MMKANRFIFLLLLWAAVAQSCIFIDDDLSVCGKDYKLNYSMRLRTNMNVELDAELSAANDSIVKQAIRQRLAPIFTDKAHDVDLSFYSINDDVRVYYDNKIIDDNSSSFTFYLPKESYRHLSVANIADAANVILEDTLSSAYSRLVSINADTLTSQTTGLFSARLDMEVNDSVDQEFDAYLYMVNSATALLIDTAGQSVKNIEVYLSRVASAFSLNDSVFDYSRPLVVKADELPIDASAAPAAPAPHRRITAKTNEEVKYVGFTTVSFPSYATPDNDGNYWNLSVYVTLPDDKVTETILSVQQPLRAGELKVIKTKLGNSGVITPIATTMVGASVTLDWKPASEQEIKF